MSVVFPIERVRADFPIFEQRPWGKPLIYLDSAATTQKPRQVIDRLTRFYSSEYGTVRRGVYSLSAQATGAYEDVRRHAARFFNAPRPEEIVFVRGVTEAINLVAIAWGRSNLQPGDAVLVSGMEHHSNIVPWQLTCAATGAELRVIPVDDRGNLEFDKLDVVLDDRVKLVSIVHISNGLGTVNPVAELARRAHAVGALVFVDGAQSAPHRRIDVQALGCDFFACSGHKMLGPTGAGVLWGRYDLLAAMEPYQGGGEMIDTVTFERSTWEDPPYRFEAGTPAFADVIGFGEALRYLDELGMDAIEQRDAALTAYAIERLSAAPGVRLHGAPAERSGLVPFTMDGIHPLDIGTILDREGVCIRVGQHCVQPLLRRFGLTATARASFGVYTTHADIDALIDGLGVVRHLAG